MSTPTNDAAEVRRFLNFLFQRMASVVLASLDPETNSTQPVSSRRFEAANIEEALKWVAAASGLRRNLHFVPGTVSPEWTGPNNPKKPDISSVSMMYADLDPRAREDRDEERERILGRLTHNLPAGLPGPAVIVDSGNGYQAFWVLNDAATCDEAEGRMKRMAEILGGDAVYNCNRLMRLPGTVNWPNAKKRAAGRIPTLASIVRLHSTTISIDILPAKLNLPALSEAPVFARGKLSGFELDSLPIAAAHRVLILHGHDPDDPGRYPSRSEALMAVCCALVRARVDDQTIFNIITDQDFHISDSVLDKRDSDRYAQRQIKRAHQRVNSPELEQLNERHAVILSVGGRARVLSREANPDFPDRQMIVLQPFQDFERRYSNRLVMIGEKPYPLGRWWLHHPDRRQYDSLTYAPGEDDEVGSFYNLWVGYGVKPTPGDCSLLIRHVYEVLADGNEMHADYILNWIAHALQFPGSCGEVALVFRGGRGTGKSTFGRVLKKIFGQHGLQLSSPGQLSGRFNAHLRDVSFVFADEAYNPGDRASESKLKALITEPTIAIEAKGLDLVEARNSIHLMIASNEEWVVPAGPDERRFAMFDVSERYKQNHEYFAALNAEMSAGGTEAFMYTMLHRDLGNWNPRQTVATAALAGQKIRSMQPELDWLHSIFNDGALPSGISSGRRGWAPSRALFDDARRRVPRLRDVSDGQLGRLLKKWGCNRETHDNVRGWRFPSLTDCRKAWEARFGRSDWDSPEEDEWAAEPAPPM